MRHRPIQLGMDNNGHTLEPPRVSNQFAERYCVACYRRAACRHERTRHQNRYPCFSHASTRGPKGPLGLLFGRNQRALPRLVRLSVDRDWLPLAPLANRDPKARSMTQSEARDTRQLDLGTTSARSFRILTPIVAPGSDDLFRGVLHAPRSRQTLFQNFANPRFLAACQYRTLLSRLLRCSCHRWSHQSNHLQRFRTSLRHRSPHPLLHRTQGCGLMTRARRSPHHICREHCQ